MPKKKQTVPYTETFRKEALRRSKEEGMTEVKVAKELGIYVEYIEVFYNHVRRHSSLGFQYPKQFEDNYYAQCA